MKKIISFLGFALALFFVQNLQAQHPHHPHNPHAKGKTTLIDMVKEDLNLTEEQEAQLAELRIELKKERKALKEEFHAAENPDRKAMHEKMKVQKEAQFQKVLNILNDEQKAILTAKKAEIEKEHAHRRFQKGAERADKMKKMKAEAKAYRKKNIEPVLAVQRAKFDEVLSEEDKATLAELRPIFKELRQRHEKRFEERKARTERPSPEMLEKRKAEHEAKRAELKPYHEKLEGLVKKYEADLEKVYAEIADERETWKKDMKAIHEKYMSEEMKNEARQRRGKEGAKPHGKKMRKHAGMKKGHFMLMEPGEISEPANTQNALTKISVFPNPASDFNTVNYEVKEAGKVKIELKDKTGKTLRVLTEGFKEVGEFSVESDLSDLRDGVYYYTITDGNRVISKKVIVSKN